MISSLAGKLESIGSDRAVINVGGIGFQVFAPSSTLGSLGHPGDTVRLFTHLHVREDNLSLYGFSSPDELTLFETLMGVSGIGPKLALAMLSAVTADRLAKAIATEDEDTLRMVPGIGKKTAGRIILELKDKMGVGLLVGSATPQARENADVIAALTSLGYTLAEAIKAVTALPISEMTLEEKIKAALRAVGR